MVMVAFNKEFDVICRIINIERTQCLLDFMPMVQLPNNLPRHNLTAYCYHTARSWNQFMLNWSAVRYEYMPRLVLFKLS